MNMDDPALERINALIDGKRVLYITTKNPDYIRVQQELSIIEAAAKELEIISSKHSSYLRRLPAIYWKLLTTHKKYDVVFVGFAPQLITTLFTWKLRRSTVIIDFFISMYDTLVLDRGIFKPNSIAASLLKNIDKRTLKVADLILCDTNEHGKYFIDVLGADADKTTTLYLNADSTYYYPRHANKPLQLTDKFIVLYFGSVLPLQGVETVIDAARNISSDDIHFFIIGPVSSGDKFESPSISYIDWLSQEQLAEHIAFADLCLAGHFNASIDKAGRVIPGKAYIYEAMGKRMILGENPANRERYPDVYDNVSFVEMGNASALSEIIQHEYNSQPDTDSN